LVRPIAPALIEVCRKVVCNQLTTHCDTLLTKLQEPLQSLATLLPPDLDLSIAPLHIFREALITHPIDIDRLAVQVTDLAHLGHQIMLDQCPTRPTRSTRNPDARTGPFLPRATMRRLNAIMSHRRVINLSRRLVQQHLRSIDPITGLVADPMHVSGPPIGPDELLLRTLRESSHTDYLHQPLHILPPLPSPRCPTSDHQGLWISWLKLCLAKLKSLRRDAKRAYGKSDGPLAERRRLSKLFSKNPNK
jgi:hypothetical protein